MSKQNKRMLRNIIAVAAALAVAYVLRMIVREMEALFLPTVLTAVRNTIHITIVVLWTASLRRRVVNKQVRRLFLATGALMAAWLLAKTVKYEFFPNNITVAARYLWYSYYVPMVMIPLIGVIITQFIGKPDTYRIPKRTYLFYVPAAILIGAVLTNDLHNLVFSFPNGIENFNSDYNYEIFYWFEMAWYIGMGIAFVALLLRKSRLPGSKQMQKLPLFIMLGAIAFWLLYTFRIINADLTVIDCLLIGALLESALGLGLIPTNSSYIELFESTSVPVIIVDEDWQAHYTSGGAVPVGCDEMKSSENGTVVLGNTLLSSAPIRAGRVLWQDDVMELNRQRSELDEIHGALAEESVLIRAETEIKEKQAQADEKNRLYDKIARDVKAQLEVLSVLLDKAERGENTRENLARVAVIGSYVKRRGNLLLLSGESKEISVRELENALRESSENLRLLDIDIALVVSTERHISVAHAVKAYDLYEKTVEAALDGLTAMFIRLTEMNGRLKLSLQLGISGSGVEQALAAISSEDGFHIEIEDGDVYVDIIPGGNEVC